MRHHRPLLAACVLAAAVLSARSAAAQATTPTTVTTAPVDSVTAAAPAPAPARAARPARPRRDLITREQALATNSRNLYEVIEHLHPTWFRMHYTGALSETGREIAVFVDDQLLGGVDLLKGMSVEQIATIQYYDGIHASALFGDRAKMGAIVVSSH
ncbi:MAG TPA: hypothetical protein VFH27_14365 [Longimicrobiaceae bacterium]|nr:hypothetical protein [Longimicrobiaceae bacterium]